MRMRALRATRSAQEQRIPVFSLEGFPMTTPYTVADALIERLRATRFTYEIPTLGNLIRLLPVYDRHHEVVLAWREAARRLGFGAETHPSQRAYQEHWQGFVDSVAESILCQAP